MKILLEHLRTFIDLPERTHDARELLDDAGIEVKTSETTDLGTVFNVELLANRGDHYCYEGIAREASGRTGGALRRPKVRRLDAQPATADRVRIDTPLCLVYTVTELERRADVSSATVGGRDVRPPLPLAPMLAADMHSTLAPVDASNLTNLELGQPTHAFDAGTIDGPIIVRLSRKGERAWLLFTPEPIEIPEGTMVIADESKILGIAGVIGCTDSGITDQTTRILLESACFDPVAVRIASRALNQPTDAAARFMRGGDPTLPLIGAGRVAQLLEEHCGYRVGNAYTAGAWRDPQRTIDVDVARTQHFIGAPMPWSEMTSRLTRYGFAVEPSPTTLRVIVPPHRLWDVHFEADFAEELLKSVGYNATAITLPHVEMGSLPSHAEDVIAQTSEVLVAEGFYEIFTDSFYSRRTRERLGIAVGDPLWEHVETQNSIEKDYSLLRNNTLAQALDALATNLNFKTGNVKMYEWARIFVADRSASNGVCTEHPILWLLANGRDRGPFWGDRGRAADAIYLKGILEQLRLALRIDLWIGASEGHRLARFFHPGRRAGIHLDQKLVGIFGEVHPSVVAGFGIKRQRPVYLELDTNALFTPPAERTYMEPPSRQPIVRNVAYAVPAGITAAEVANTLREAAPQFLREIRIVDLYEMPNDANRARAITYEIEYLPEEAVTGETINAATEAMMAAVTARFGERVSLRA
ncbi:MAG TPA: phenylalanine--tRNA ligase subunit beta [Thermoanaerobaculia bacterium]|nr:phenylalanine--tRNA ligase subunit beta [Thermoanaerobaculia bacterium]